MRILIAILAAVVVLSAAGAGAEGESCPEMAVPTGEFEIASVATVLAAAQERWGSIVFSQEPDGGYAWGMGWGYGSHSSATSRAVDECRDRGGSNCQEIAWSRNACGALTIGDSNGYGYGWGRSTAAAEDRAMTACRNYNRNCRLVISRCSTR